jgi:hypothetical protein
VKLHTYKNYDEYVKTQIKGNRKKADRIWVNKDNIKTISEYVKYSKTGICHGVRTGAEVDYFSEFLPECTVYGTDIGPILNKKNCFRHDFNYPFELKEVYGTVKADFVYSNSFDHAFTPLGTLTIWAGQLNEGGKIIIEHSSGHEGSDALDPFGATVEEIIELFSVINFKTNVIDLKVKKGYKYQVAIIGDKNA